MLTLGCGRGQEERQLEAAAKAKASQRAADKAKVAELTDPKSKAKPAAAEDDADWQEKIENLIGRFSIPKELAVSTLVEAGGHGGKAVMALGLDVVANPEEAEIRDMFNTIDEDGSGTLESDEIAMLAVELGNPMTDDEVAEAMEEMDADGGGDVDWEEFLFW